MSESGKSILDHVLEQQQELARRAEAHATNVATFQQQKEDFLKESSLWRSRATHQDEREKQLDARQKQLEQRSSELDEREKTLMSHGDNSTIQQLLTRAAFLERRATDHFNREGDLGQRENDLRLREEDYTIRMNRLRVIVEEYFRAPSK